MSTSTAHTNRIMDNSYSEKTMTKLMQTLVESHAPEEICQFVDRRIGGLLRVVDAELLTGDEGAMPLQLRFGNDRLSEESREVVTRSLETVLGETAALSNAKSQQPRSGITLKSRSNGNPTSNRASATFSTEVASSMAHKLRNYLAAIMSAGEQLQDTLDHTATADQLQLAELVSRAALEQRVLIDRFVYAFGPMNVRNQKTNIGQLIRLNLERLESTCGYRVACDNTTKPIQGNTDYEMLGRIIVELASNAAEVSPQSNPSLNWHIDSGQLIITIDNAEQSALDSNDVLQNKPFVSNKPGHVGLGLSIVRRYVDALRGTLQITHADDRTTVVVTIPIQTEDQTSLHTERNP